MRKINQPAFLHNDCRFHNTSALAGKWAEASAALTLCVMLSLVLAGCQGAATDDQPAETEAPGLPLRSVMNDCPVVITTAAFQEFMVSAEEVATTGELSAQQVERLAANPTYARWMRSFELKDLNVETVADCLVYGARGRGEVVHGSPPPRSISTALSMGYSFAEAEPITTLLQRYIADQSACRILDRVNGFLTPEDRPDTVYLDFIAGKSEVRFFEDHAMVDVGLALASGPGQLNRILSGLLYRSLGEIEGPRPSDVGGAEAVYNILRVVVNQGISAWLDDLTNLYFGHDHPRLDKASPVPEQLVGQGYRAVHKINSELTRLLGDPELLATDTDALNHYLIGSGSYATAGMVMAMIIEKRLGLPRLQQSSHTVSSFLRAYQEAALAAPAESTVPVGSLEYYFDNLPPLDPQIFDDLLRLVEQEENDSP